MFIIQDKKIISERDLRISKARLVQLMFLFMDTTFQTADKFTLTAGETTNSLYGFTKSGFLKFAKVDFNFIDKQSSQVEITIYQGAEIILQDTLFVQAEIQGGGQIQGIIYNNLPKLASEVQICPPSLTANITNFKELFSRCSQLKKISQLDTSKGTDFNGMFYACNKLESIPQLDTSQGTDFKQMFYYCHALVTIPQLDTSQGTVFNGMFYNCKILESIPQLDTSQGTNFGEMFYYCSKLKSIPPQLDTSQGTEFGAMFSWCSALTKIPQLNVGNGTKFTNMFYGCGSLIDFGGLLGVKLSYSLRDSTKLTHDSLLNVLNGLADLTGGTAQTLTLGATNLAKLTDQEKSIATNKNWNLA